MLLQTEAVQTAQAKGVKTCARPYGGKLDISLLRTVQLYSGKEACVHCSTNTVSSQRYKLGILDFYPYIWETSKTSYPFFVGFICSGWNSTSVQNIWSVFVFLCVGEV